MKKKVKVCECKGDLMLTATFTFEGLAEYVSSQREEGFQFIGGETKEVAAVCNHCKGRVDLPEGVRVYFGHGLL